MKAVPRILPLVAVAIGGVVAVKGLADVQALPAMFAAAAAHAETGAPPSPPPPQPHAASPLPPDLGRPASPLAKGPAPVCARSPAEIAKEAGLSPGELQALQNLGARRGQLDDRERALDTQLQLLAAAEAKVDAKMKALNGVKGQIQALLGQADQQQQAEIDRLVTVYQKMKPRDAAAVMATLDDKVRVPVAAKMKEQALAAILSYMPTLEAKKLTELLAHRYASLDPITQPPGAPGAGGTAPPTDAASPPPQASEPAAAKAPAKLATRSARSPRRRHARRPDTPAVAAAKAALDPKTTAAAKADPAAAAPPKAAAASPQAKPGSPG